MSHTPKLAAGEGRRGRLGGCEHDPSQTKRAGAQRYACSQQRGQRVDFLGVFGHWHPLPRSPIVRENSLEPNGHPNDDAHIPTKATAL